MCGSCWYCCYDDDDDDNDDDDDALLTCARKLAIKPIRSILRPNKAENIYLKKKLKRKNR